MRRLTFIPQTNIGKWSGLATGVFLGLIVVSELTSRALVTSNEVDALGISPAFSILGVTTFLFGLLAFILGMISLCKRDFSLFAIFAVVLGLFPIFFIIGQIIP